MSAAMAGVERVELIRLAVRGLCVVEGLALQAARCMTMPIGTAATALRTKISVGLLPKFLKYLYLFLQYIGDPDIFFNKKWTHFLKITGYLGSGESEEKRARGTSARGTSAGGTSAKGTSARGTSERGTSARGTRARGTSVRGKSARRQREREGRESGERARGRPPHHSQRARGASQHT